MKKLPAHQKKSLSSYPTTRPLLKHFFVGILLLGILGMVPFKVGAQTTSRGISMDTLYLSNKQHFSGQVRKFGGYKVKIFSLENANSKKMKYRFAYDKIDSVSANTFDKKGRTFEQIKKQALLNSRIALGFGTVNVGLGGFIDIPIQETQNISFRINIGGIGYTNPYEEFNYSSKAYEYTHYDTYLGGSHYAGGGRSESDYTNAHRVPKNYFARPSFYLDFEPRGYFTARKCAVKPYFGLLLGINRTTFFSSFYKETKTMQTTTYTATRTTVTQNYDVETYSREVEKMSTHIGFTAGTEFYFGERTSMGVGYRYMLVNNNSNRVNYTFQRYDSNGNLETESKSTYDIKYLSAHLLTVEIKYLINLVNLSNKQVTF